MSLTLKSLLSTKGQKRNRAAWKMNLFTTLAERNLCSKKVMAALTSNTYFESYVLYASRQKADEI